MTSFISPSPRLGLGCRRQFNPQISSTTPTSTTTTTTTTTTRRQRWLSELVVVAGGTGGVGRLVIDRLLAAQKTPESELSLSSPLPNSLRVTHVRALVRDAKRARQVLPVDDKLLTLHELSGLSSSSSSLNVTTNTDESKENDDLCYALRDASALIICTGTTAFPTRAWRNGNTPRAVDDKLVNDLTRSVNTSKIKRVVLASSIGTYRPKQFPFIILNAFGVLDAKRRGEQHVRNHAKEKGYSYSIVRVGRLVGEPQTNIGMLRSKPNPSWQDIRVEKGDELVGDLTRDAAADALVFATSWDTNANLDFSVVNALGCSPPAAKWLYMLGKIEMKNVGMAGV